MDLQTEQRQRSEKEHSFTKDDIRMQDSPVTGEAGDPQTHAPRKGEREKGKG